MQIKTVGDLLDAIHGSARDREIDWWLNDVATTVEASAELGTNVSFDVAPNYTCDPSAKPDSSAKKTARKK